LCRLLLSVLLPAAISIAATVGATSRFRVPVVAIVVVARFAGDQLVELAAVEPDPPTLGANVDLDSRSFAFAKGSPQLGQIILVLTG
jgi:hypothetical protein